MLQNNMVCIMMTNLRRKSICRNVFGYQVGRMNYKNTINVSFYRAKQSLSTDIQVAHLSSIIPFLRRLVSTVTLTIDLKVVGDKFLDYLQKRTIFDR